MSGAHLPPSTSAATSCWATTSRPSSSERVRRLELAGWWARLEFGACARGYSSKWGSGSRVALTLPESGWELLPHFFSLDAAAADLFGSCLTTTAGCFREVDRHAGAMWIDGVLAEGRARLEADLRIQRASWYEGIPGSGLETHPLIIPVGRHRQEVIDHCPSDSSAAGGFAGVH